MSVKRRRGIGFRKWLVVALKDYAKRVKIVSPSKGIVSHTTVTNRILRGKIPPIPSYEKYKDDDRTKQGISMPEELWLALKAYGKQRGKDESDTQVACKIIVGKIPPIPKHCIEEGERLARQREADRALNPTKSKRPKKKKAEKKGKESDDHSCETELPPGASSKEPLGSVKEELQERKILDEQTERKHDKNGRRLSKGEPFDEKKGSKDQSINPDDDFYGGIFNI